MRREDKSPKIGLGVGYVSIMLIFAVVCLTIFAVLSLKAALSDESFNERSSEFLTQYYNADTAAKETLSKLDSLAYEARKSDFFEDAFENNVKRINDVSVARVQGGIAASYSVPINEHQKLVVEIVFDENGEYKIEQWQSMNISEDTSESHLNVWDGSL
ncbi:MAG: hypothetical protein MR364_06280 [Oscillospiraceae bacterium]|nr:hypothetical protein [Oscillospiraceae bacterium]